MCAVKRNVPPIVCIAGGSGSGKTTFLERLIPELTGMGVKVGTIKHHAGPFDMDIPGKDTWRHRQAGAVATIISSPRSIGMVRDVDHDHGPEELVSLLGRVDIVLAEGYKRVQIPKIEIFRPEIHERPFCTHDVHLMALVTDADADLGVPRFAMDDARGLAVFLLERFGLGRDPAKDP